MKQDLFNVIKKYIIKNGHYDIYLNDTPFGKYNDIERMFITEKNNLYVIKINDLSNIISLTDFIKTKDENFLIELLLTIYEKINEIKT